MMGRGLLEVCTLYFAESEEIGGILIGEKCALAGLPKGLLSNSDPVRLRLISNIWWCSCRAAHDGGWWMVDGHPLIHFEQQVAQASLTETMGTKQGQGAEPQTILGTRLSST
jgi:hypothetical protein